jgi:hypothetical protein
VRDRQEPVQVVHRDGVPEQFLRGDRLYLVRSVLSSWVQSEPWWLGASAAALSTGETPVPASVGLLDQERRFWRVEAAAGRSASVGVYDLCTDGGSWRLARVLD